MILGRLLKLIIEGNHGASPVVFALGAVVTLARKDAGCACEVYEPNGDSMLNDLCLSSVINSLEFFLFTVVFLQHFFLFSVFLSSPSL